MAWQLFYNTIAIVFGILFPIIVVAIITGVAQAMKGLQPALEAKLDEQRKQPPFDEVEVNVNPATNVMTARFIKNDVVVWQGNASRNEIEAADGEVRFRDDRNS